MYRKKYISYIPVIWSGVSTVDPKLTAMSCLTRCFFVIPFGIYEKMLWRREMLFVKKKKRNIIYNLKSNKGIIVNIRIGKFNGLSVY